MSTPLNPSMELIADLPAAGVMGWAERGWVPDALVRVGIRRLCAERLATCNEGGISGCQERNQRLIQSLRRSPMAIHTDAANAQHYEVPTAFFQQCLGQRLKYSSCYFPEPDTSLEQAEVAMLELYAQRAQLLDGQEVLELGCGWGSLTLWMAERFPHSRITAVSNSNSQRAYILAQCRQRGLGNVQVITCDINTLELARDRYDRCVSVEMFEHVRNHEVLMARIAGWLRPSGQLFVHIFAHRHAAYLFETQGSDNWMGRHFFTGGMMPASDTLHWFQNDLQLQQQWLVDGTHYERTANAWLARQDAHRASVLAVLRDTYGNDALAKLWLQRWRIFWMSCAELFGYANGQEWLVAHYRFARPD